MSYLQLEYKFHCCLHFLGIHDHNTHWQCDSNAELQSLDRKSNVLDPPFSPSRLTTITSVGVLCEIVLVSYTILQRLQQ